MDIFFREYVKDIVPDINSLKVRIQHAILTITWEILANIWTEIDNCLDILWATTGALHMYTDHVNSSHQISYIIITYK